MREEQWMSPTLTWARFLTGSLTVQLYPGWDIMVRRDSMMWLFQRPNSISTKQEMESGKSGCIFTLVCRRASLRKAKSD
ncbi:hypothetical protein QYF61_021437 [Mycteria americana]|uniref:Uncharacterized protein n=1 Tax=Mycteria americana TaxID=33587 RepID=A0AAN7NQP3_MYCAM|nr:hypothetical protein QYF61_021437 [Mycteria americana]